MYLGASFHDADEATDKAMTDAYRSWSRIESNHFAWTVQAMRSHLLKAMRQNRRAVGRPTTDDLDRPATKSEAPNAWDDVEWVQQQLAALPPAQREVMALIYDGFKRAEIAELLGKSPEAIRQNLRQARRKLRLALGLPLGSTDRQKGGER